MPEEISQEQKKLTKDNDVDSFKGISRKLKKLKKLVKCSAQRNDENLEPHAGKKTQDKRTQNDRPDELDKFVQLNHQQRKRPALQVLATNIPDSTGGTAKQHRVY